MKLVLMSYRTMAAKDASDTIVEKPFEDADRLSPAELLGTISGTIYRSLYFYEILLKHIFT